MSARQELIEHFLNFTDADMEKFERCVAKMYALLPDQQENNAREMGTIEIIERILKLPKEQFKMMISLYEQQEQTEQARRSA